MPGVSVALPVRSAADTLRCALACIQSQSLSDYELLIILNGSDPATRQIALDHARADHRARVIELPKPSLPAALNLALREARHDLVARMDADDTCHPGRLAAQVNFMRAHPSVAALGTAWELADPDGRVTGVVRPPTDPRRLRWRLLLGNLLAHGSMMLRREAVLAAGGYDESCARAQDFDLWVRLVRTGASERGGIACLPETLYKHYVRRADDPSASTADQAEVVAPILAREWASLPAASDGGVLAAAMARVLARERGGGDASAIERHLDEHGPTREGLLAWLWAQWTRPAMPRRAAEVCRAARLREVGAALRDAGARTVWLWGAGEHTRWLLEHAEDLGVPIAGVVDDAAGDAAREVGGHAVRPPTALEAGAHTLISSDWHEEAIWERSAGARARGVRVWRMYDEGARE
ncbi:MAG: glycosyltransferase [Phycisphaerae bacterium]|nr:glycosyltransferase [Phycisphaerae bacterium]